MVVPAKVKKRALQARIERLEAEVAALKTRPTVVSMPSPPPYQPPYEPFKITCGGAYDDVLNPPFTGGE